MWRPPGWYVWQDAGPLWLKDFRARTLEKGALHTYGGSDYFAWRPRGDPVMAAIGGHIPCFTYGRGKASSKTATRIRGRSLSGFSN